MYKVVVPEVRWCSTEVCVSMKVYGTLKSMCYYLSFQSLIHHLDLPPMALLTWGMVISSFTNVQNIPYVLTAELLKPYETTFPLAKNFPVSTNGLACFCQMDRLLSPFGGKV